MLIRKVSIANKFIYFCGLNMNELTNQELLDALKYGHHWHMTRIKNELEAIIASTSNDYHVLKWQKDENLYYLYDSECYLFFENGLISIRSDKDNVASTDKTVNYPINSMNDIRIAYEGFIALTLEGEN